MCPLCVCMCVHVMVRVVEFIMWDVAIITSMVFVSDKMHSKFNEC